MLLLLFCILQLRLRMLRMELGLNKRSTKITLKSIEIYHGCAIFSRPFKLVLHSARVLDCFLWAFFSLFNSYCYLLPVSVFLHKYTEELNWWSISWLCSAVIPHQHKMLFPEILTLQYHRLVVVYFLLRLYQCFLTSYSNSIFVTVLLIWLFIKCGSYGWSNSQWSDC